MTFANIGVLGGGTMGAGIAHSCAAQGLSVCLVERDQVSADRATHTIANSLGRSHQRGELSDQQHAAALQLFTATTDLDSLADRDLVIEAIAEDEAQKTAAFQAVDEILQRDDAIIASNTSSIPIMKLAVATSRPDRVIGLHFFNPVPVMRLIEIVPSLLTGPGTVDRVTTFVEQQLGKRPIRCEDRAGFVVNALLIPYLLAAIRMHESGFAAADDIDLGMVEGCRHPMGPLQLCDLIGLDTVLAVAKSLYEEFKEPLFAPPPLLSRMVEAGLLGRKVGRGFYEHRTQVPA